MKCSIPILVASLLALPNLQAEVEYTADGVPTPLEEEIRWHLNRGRFDSTRENQARQTSYTDIPARTGPVAPHQALTLAARHHSEDMARNNRFQHETIPGSSYYNAVTQPSPWDRIRAEGYSYSSAAENIAAGYGNAMSAYVGWWNSTGHRKNMYNAGHREVGNGYYYLVGSSYGRYYTMDLCSSGGVCFFTDTVFRDANADFAYNEGEGVAGIRIRLRLATSDHAIFDISNSSGGFAIPIQVIGNGTRVEVWLMNTTAAATRLTVPRDYANLTALTLPPGIQTLVGVFTKPALSQNLGFRDMTQIVAPTVPRLAIARLNTGIELSWLTQTGVNYWPQASLDLIQWTDLVPAPLVGTGSQISHSEALAADKRFFRIRLQPGPN